MAVGQNHLLGAYSYIAFGRETTTGTYNTCNAGFDFLSSSLKVNQDTRILPQIQRKRTYSKSIQLGKNVGGDVEFYFYPNNTACNWLLQNAFGGTVTSATATGETTGGGGFQHIFGVSDFINTYGSLCVNLRKGDSTSGRIWEYNGVKVNTLRLEAQLDEPLMVMAGLVGIDATVTTNDVESNLTASADECLSFVNGRFSVETTFASLTSSSFWHCQSVVFNLNNNLKSGSEVRRIGSDIPDLLARGVATFELNATIRFDTTTAYDAMIAQTELSAEFEFLGDTISGSVAPIGLLLEFQKLKIKDAGDPDISGPDNVLTANVVFDVLRDESASGYAVRATVTNNIASATFA